jgi:hypothetical protein
VRSAACARSRSSRPASQSDRRDGHPDGSPGEGGNNDNSDCVCDGKRPGPAGARFQPEPTRGQHHGRNHPCRRARTEEAELLHELVPDANLVAALVNPNGPNLAPLLTDLETAARVVGLRLQIVHASTEQDLDAVFPEILRLRAGALVIGVDTFFNSQSVRLAALALKYKIPAMY